MKETSSTLALLIIIIVVASTLFNDPDCFNKEERKLNAICKERLIFDSIKNYYYDSINILYFSVLLNSERE